MPAEPRAARPSAPARVWRPFRAWRPSHPSTRPSQAPLFRRSRRRIVAAILGVLIVLVAGMVALIYATSYREVSARNERMLRQYASVYWEHGLPGTDAPPSSSDPWPAGQPQSEPATDADADSAQSSAAQSSAQPSEQSSAAQSTDRQGPAGLPATDTYTSQTFYAVVFDANGTVTDHAGNSSAGITEATLAAAGRSMADRHHIAWAHADAGMDEPDTAATGSLGQWMYRIEQYDGRTLVVMMDNTVMDDNMATLMRHTAVFGAVAFALLAVAACVLARLITSPLERAHAEQRRFVADAGHELKTPVATIGVNAELLRRDIGDNPWLDNIAFENRRMGRLVAQLLELAHAEARAEAVPSMDGRMPSVDLSRLASGCLLACEPVAFERGLRFEERIDKGVLVSGDETRLGELVSILFDNAVDHAHVDHTRADHARADHAAGHADDARPDATDCATAGTADGTDGAGETGDAAAATGRATDHTTNLITDETDDIIRVTLRAERGRAILRVSNPGDLSQEQIDHLFDRFYRADDARRATNGHYGLGLSIAHAIVTAHHGTIACGSGSGRVTFTVRLPLA